MKMDLAIPVFILFYIMASSCDARRKVGFCSNLYHPNSDCPRRNFLCMNKKCISRELFANGRDDCGDDSDERSLYGDCSMSMYRCDRPYIYNIQSICIPTLWFCDGITDCRNSEDEIKCRSLGNEDFIRNRTLQWLLSQRNTELLTESWGSQVDKSAVALYLADPMFAIKSNRMMKEIGYEVSIQLLSRLSKKNLRDIPSYDIASYVNAFLVTCVNPRKFHGMDLIQELRSRVDGQDYTIPYVFLALCNAGETITEKDQRKLIHAFNSPKRTFWTDIQAFVVMALACAKMQPGNRLYPDIILDTFVGELKDHQYSNGTVENLQTTALVLQALIAADPNPDSKTFDERKALLKIYDMQQSDGSFGSFLDTYYVLPVLYCKSLANISTDHCQYSDKDEISALEELRIQSGPKIRVRYSLWIGNNKDLERNLALRVPANMSFYSTMEMAAEIDTRYRFEYVVKDSKPYVNAVYGIKDNPEKNKFWFLYTFVDGNPIPSQEHPVDIIPKDHQHFVMWYRSGSWVE